MSSAAPTRRPPYSETLRNDNIQRLGDDSKSLDVDLDVVEVLAGNEVARTTVIPSEAQGEAGDKSIFMGRLGTGGHAFVIVPKGHPIPKALDSPNCDTENGDG